MAGTIEITQEGEGTFLSWLTAGDGTAVTDSPTFATIKAAVEGIAAVREIAATAPVVITPPARHHSPATREDLMTPAIEFPLTTAPHVPLPAGDFRRRLAGHSGPLPVKGIPVEVA